MTYSGSPWYEVQGLAPCPAQPCPDTCTVPEGGEWLAIYFLDNEAQARATLLHVLDSEDPMYDRYDDFRMVEPTTKAVKRHEANRKMRVA